MLILFVVAVLGTREAEVAAQDTMGGIGVGLIQEIDDKCKHQF